MDFTFVHDRPSSLVKEKLATRLRQEILSGRIKPGERIVEGKWAQRFGVAQTSIREALNILIAEGFVQKGHGRSARVIKMSEADVTDVYDVRAALQGAAARLIAERRPDLSDLDDILEEMRCVTRGTDLRAILECVIRFHLTLCEKSGNRWLLEQFSRLVVPFYAFTLMRVLANQVGPKPWADNIGVHEQIIGALKSGDPFFAEHYVSRAILGFGRQASEVWAREKPSHAAGG